jgi:hypothetical protein
MNVTALPGRALTTVLSKIFRRSCAAPRLLAWWKLLCSGTSKNTACQRTKEIGSLLGARAGERETTCESSITCTNPPNACMHGRIKFTLRYKSVAESQCVHVHLDIVGSERRMRRTWQTSTRPWRTCAASRLCVWSRMFGACKLMKVRCTHVELPRWKIKGGRGNLTKFFRNPRSMCLIASSLKPCPPVVCKNNVLARVNLGSGGERGVSRLEPQLSAWVWKERTYLEYPSAPSVLVIDHVWVAIKQVSIVVGGCTGE